MIKLLPAALLLAGFVFLVHGGEALYRAGSLHASYFHAWFASSPRAVAHLLGGEGA